MPLTRIGMRRGKSAEYKLAVIDAVYEAIRDTFNVPEDDRFMMIDEYDADNFNFGAHYFDIARSDDLIIIQATVSNTRTIEQKKALFARIAALLVDKPGVRNEDIFINLVEVQKQNWSFGHGRAQYAE